MKLSSIPAGEADLSKALRVPGAGMVTRHPSSEASDHKNIIATMAVDPCRVTTLPLACIRSDATQVIDLQYISLLPARFHLASLSRSGVLRARTRTQSWRDQDVQQPKSFVWSPMRPTNWLCLRRRSPIHASLIWFDCSRDRPHGTSFKPKLIAGRETASRSKEVAP